MDKRLQPLSLGALIILVMALASPVQASNRTHDHPQSSRCRQDKIAHDAPLPFGTAPCPGVRPGALLLLADGSFCSFNFLFKGSDGNRYIGTAGHCAVEQGEEKSWAGDTGAGVTDSEEQPVGHFAYGLLKGPYDFSLIKLNKGVKASAQMCYFGGPTGTNDDISDDTVVLRQFGHGTGLGYEPVTKTNTLPARTLLALGMPDPDTVWADGAAIFGDSGSGVISEDGRAVGVLVNGTLRTSGPTSTGFKIGITRISPQLRRAMKVLGLQLKLVTANLL